MSAQPCAFCSSSGGAYGALLIVFRFLCFSRTRVLHPSAFSLRWSKHFRDAVKSKLPGIFAPTSLHAFRRPLFLRLKMYAGNYHEYADASLDGSLTAFHGYAPQATSPSSQAQLQSSHSFHQYHHLQTNMPTSTSASQLSSTLQQGDEMTVDHLLDNVGSPTRLPHIP
jgi:hypothetical protein